MVVLEQTFLADQKMEGVGWEKNKQHPIVSKSHH